MELLWQVERVLLDGKPTEAPQPEAGHAMPDSRFSGHWQGSRPVTVKAGDHQVVVEVQCAYVDQHKLIGLNAGDLPVDRWPEALKRWKQSVSAPLKVYPVGKPIVSLVRDPGQSPGPDGGITIDRLVVQADRDGKKKIILKVDFTPGPSPSLPFTSGPSLPLSYDVSVAIDGRPGSLNLGPLWIVRSANGSTQSGGQLEGRIDRFDPSILAADIILTPNPAHVEQMPEVSKIWGKKVILRGIPLERLDLKVKAAP